MARKVEVLPYDRNWPSVFRKEAQKLWGLLGENVAAIHHIGSTSIPGMAAKPIIDILLVVRDHDLLDACNETMSALGYQPMGENGLPGRRYFRKLRGDLHLFHIHAFEEGHADIARHINFRDYFRAHPGDARAYQDLKLSLAAQFPFGPEDYSSGKTDFIQAVDRRASLWRTAVDLLNDEA